MTFEYHLTLWVINLAIFFNESTSISIKLFYAKRKLAII